MEYRAAVLLLAVVLLLLVFRKELLFWLRARNYKRGRQVRKSKPSTKPPENLDLLRWGNSYLPRSAATQHLFVMGTTGSGKTHVQRLFMRDALKGMRGRDERAVILDSKGDTAAFLQKAGITETPVYSLCPFESRNDFPIAVSWDAGRDITSPTRALNLASAIIPEEKGGSNKFFTNGARHIVSGVLKSLVWHNAGQWTFSDFIYILLRRDVTKQVLGRDESGRSVLSTYLRDDKTGDDVYSTLCTHIAYYEPIAALWQRAEKKLSIREWLDTNSILLLGVNSTAKASLDVLNATFFSTLADNVDVMASSDVRRIWTWIDEAREAESIMKNDGLRLLLNNGRSRGVSICMAAQDLAGLYQAAGKERADEILGQCSNLALLRVQSQFTAEWSAKQIGSNVTLQSFLSHSGGSQLRSSVSEQRVQEEAVMASEFFSLPVTSRNNGLHGYFITPTHGVERATIPPAEIEPIVTGEELEKLWGVKYRSESEEWLREWTAADKRRLALTEEHALRQVKNPKLKLHRNTVLEGQTLPRNLVGE